MVQRVGVALVVLALTAAACSGGTNDDASVVTGSIVAVTGDVVVESFVVKDNNGSSHQFTVAQDTVMDVDELRALVVSQVEVTVDLVRTDADNLIAVSLDISG